MTINNLIFLQAGFDAGTINLLFMGGILVVFYFLMIRPQMKKQKMQAKFLEELKEGDKIVTTSGILGKVIKVEKNAVALEIGAGTKTTVRVLRSAISKEMTENAYTEEDK